MERIIGMFWDLCILLLMFWNVIMGLVLLVLVEFEFEFFFFFLMPFCSYSSENMKAVC